MRPPYTLIRSFATRQSSLPASLTTSRLCTLSNALRPFGTSFPLFGPKPLPPRPILLDSEIEESFLRGSGPGGQKINKTSSAVQLKHLPTGIVVKCQASRSRAQNRNTARRLLQDRIEEVQLGSEARTEIRRREAGKKKDRAARKRKAKYLALDEAKQNADEEGITAMEQAGDDPSKRAGDAGEAQSLPFDTSEVADELSSTTDSPRSSGAHGHRAPIDRG